MSVQFIQKKSAGTETSPTSIADDATGRAIIENYSRAAGLAYDRASNTFKYNGNDAIKELVATDATQALTNKSGLIVSQEALFTQVAGNKTHTAAFTIPAGATITDILVTNTVVWNSGTSATLKIGIQGGDDDCFYTGLDVKTKPAAGKTLNFSNPAAANGASVPAIDGGAANTQLGATTGFLYSATAQIVAAVLTDLNVSGTNGRTRVTVLYSLPPTVIAPTVV
jgi:hypothetical protein